MNYRPSSPTVTRIPKYKDAKVRQNNLKIPSLRSDRSPQSPHLRVTFCRVAV